MARALFGRCPACGRAPLYVRWAEIFTICPECHVRHDRFEGSWLAAAGMSSMVGLSIGAWGSVWLYMSGRPISLPLLLVVSGIGMVGSYRPFKGLVFGTLHWLGMVFRDPVREGNLVNMEAFKQRRSREHREHRDAG